MGCWGRGVRRRRCRVWVLLVIPGRNGILMGMGMRSGIEFDPWCVNMLYLLDAVYFSVWWLEPSERASECISDILVYARDYRIWFGFRYNFIFMIHPVLQCRSSERITWYFEVHHILHMRGSEGGMPIEASDMIIPSGIYSGKCNSSCDMICSNMTAAKNFQEWL